MAFARHLCHFNSFEDFSRFVFNDGPANCKALQSIEPRNRHIAGGWLFTVEKLAPPMHGYSRDRTQKRVCSAEGRRWHCCRSCGASNLSLAPPSGCCRKKKKHKERMEEIEVRCAGEEVRRARFGVVEGCNHSIRGRRRRFAAVGTSVFDSLALPIHALEATGHATNRSAAHYRLRWQRCVNFLKNTSCSQCSTVCDARDELCSRSSPLWSKTSTISFPNRWLSLAAQNMETGQDLWLGRGQFDECAYGLAEVSSTSSPTACLRSVPSACLRFVRDPPLYRRAPKTAQAFGKLRSTARYWTRTSAQSATEPEAPGCKPVRANMYRIDFSVRANSVKNTGSAQVGLASAQ